MRIDTTVVETNIHYPTDSSLLGDGVRVLIRTMKKVAGIANGAGARLRDRTRSVRRHVLNIARAARAKSAPNRAKLNEIYGKLLAATGRVVGQARRFACEIAAGVKCAADPRRQLRLIGLREVLEAMLPRVAQVMRQTRARIFAGNTRAEGKIVSLFGPSTEVIRKGKARIELHQTKLGRTPHLVAADAAFYSRQNEAAAKKRGVKRVCIPNHATKSAARKREQKKRWFRNGQKWRTGCEGRISVIKRQHGLARSRYRGDDGMKRWVGLGVIADNLLNIARASPKPKKPAG